MAVNAHEAKMAHPRMAAGALFFDAADRVLMVEPTYKDYWEVPGGYVETGESPLQAAVREVHEELGITSPIGRLLAVDWAPSEAEGDKCCTCSMAASSARTTSHRSPCSETS
jgi:ADP-ribose pyrophosphatase YjhB (NUDIX family)